MGLKQSVHGASVVNHCLGWGRTPQSTPSNRGKKTQKPSIVYWKVYIPQLTVHIHKIKLDPFFIFLHYISKLN